ncbi:protein of unknown function [Georgfuchsia toluolica]|uniref:Uncharacterized protein n=1 Tax=Georgfuchsia toluolica TaxID=424218 RepID=A0A916J0C9_9PROT|nr:protein of unknown function [Georgfuchsia toluolica]
MNLSGRATYRQGLIPLGIQLFFIQLREMKLGTDQNLMRSTPAYYRQFCKRIHGLFQDIFVLLAITTRTQ